MTRTGHTTSTNAAGSTVMTSKTGRSASMSITRAAGNAGAAILLFVSGFHAYWGAGGTWGAATAYPATGTSTSSGRSC